MLNKLQELNFDIKLLDINDDGFKKYGQVIKIDASDIISEASKLSFPEKGTQYIPSVKELENSANFNKEFGFMDTQAGICHGFNSHLNALEYHKSSEINIAVTDMVLILGYTGDIKGKEYHSKNVEAFYLKKGDAVELYSTTLHFCPCQVNESGFSCIVVLPRFTNEVLTEKSDDMLLFKKNKWVMCHELNESLKSLGVYPGIHGINYEIKYN